MIARLEPADRQLSSPLGQVSPLAKLGVAVVWFVGLAFTTDLRPPLVLVAIALLAALTFGRVAGSTLAWGLAPLWAVALAIGLFNAAGSGRMIRATRSAILVEPEVPCAKADGMSSQRPSNTARNTNFFIIFSSQPTHVQRKVGHFNITTSHTVCQLHRPFLYLSPLAH